MLLSMHMYQCIFVHTYIQTHVHTHTSKQTKRQTNITGYKQAYRQTCICIYIITYIHTEEAFEADWICHTLLHTGHDNRHNYRVVNLGRSMYERKRNLIYIDIGNEAVQRTYNKSISHRSQKEDQNGVVASNQHILTHICKVGMPKGRGANRRKKPAVRTVQIISSRNDMRGSLLE